MGREWHWGRSFRRGGGEREKHSPAGCMSGVLHLFDLHHLLFTTRTDGVVGDSPFPTSGHRHGHDLPKGVEAPRNSLELDVATTTTSSVSFGGADDYEIPVVPKRKPSLEEEEEEERSLQGSSRTGNVVAKLMGLDRLPDQTTSSFSPRKYYYEQEVLLSPSVTRSQKHQYQKKKKQQQMDSSTSRRGSQTPPPRHPLQPRNCNIMVDNDYAKRGTRSLPETPRISFARRSWDSDPRHSVQSNISVSNNYNKENMTASALQELKCICEDYSTLSPSPPLFLAAKAKGRDRRQQQVDENRNSPSHYAREIVRQMKDSVSRRIERGRAKAFADQTSKATPIPTTPPPPCSPRQVLAEPPRAKSSTMPEPEQDRIPAVAVQEQVSSKTTPKPQPPPPPPPVSSKQQPKPLAPAAKCKKASCERFTEKLKKPPPAATTTPAAVRKKALVSPSPTSTPQSPRRCKTQQSLPSYVDATAQREKKPQPAPPPPPQPRQYRSPPPVAVEEPTLPEELHYVKRIMEQAGVRGHTPLPFAVRWNSPSHPLDPIIFHQLELTSPTSYLDGSPLNHRCNRKLLFNLVDEILGDLLWPYLFPTAFQSSSPRPRPALDGDTLIHQLWSQIKSLPSADCQVIQDIDALVERDLPDANVRRLLLHPAVAEEAESIATELERILLDSLVGDAAATLQMG